MQFPKTSRKHNITILTENMTKGQNIPKATFQYRIQSENENFSMYDFDEHEIL